jgi:hypothetical protein
MGPPVTGLTGKEKNHPFHGWIFISIIFLLIVILPSFSILWIVRDNEGLGKERICAISVTDL